MSRNTYQFLLFQPSNNFIITEKPYFIGVFLEFPSFSALLNGNGEGRIFKGLRGVCALWVCYSALLITFHPHTLL